MKRLLILVLALGATRPVLCNYDVRAILSMVVQHAKDSEDNFPLMQRFKLQREWTSLQQAIHSEDIYSCLSHCHYLITYLSLLLLFPKNHNHNRYSIQYNALQRILQSLALLEPDWHIPTDDCFDMQCIFCSLKMIIPEFELLPVPTQNTGKSQEINTSNKRSRDDEEFTPNKKRSTH